MKSFSLYRFVTAINKKLYFPYKSINAERNGLKMLTEEGGAVAIDRKRIFDRDVKEITSAPFLPRL